MIIPGSASNGDCAPGGCEIKSASCYDRGVQQLRSNMNTISARTAGLAFVVICLAFSSTNAQQQRRGKPPAKTAGVEQKDPAEIAAELFEAGQNAHQKGE